MLKRTQKHTDRKWHFPLWRNKIGNFGWRKGISHIGTITGLIIIVDFSIQSFCFTEIYKIHTQTQTLTSWRNFDWSTVSSFHCQYNNNQSYFYIHITFTFFFVVSLPRTQMYQFQLFLVGFKRKWRRRKKICITNVRQKEKPFFYDRNFKINVKDLWLKIKIKINNETFTENKTKLKLELLLLMFGNGREKTTTNWREHTWKG